MAVNFTGNIKDPPKELTVFEVVCREVQVLRNCKKWWWFGGTQLREGR